MDKSQRRYSAAYKAKLTARMKGPDPVSPRTLAAETGVGQSTLYRWLDRAKERPLTEESREPGEPLPRGNWTLSEKLRVLQAAQALSGVELGAYLRREGVHPEELRAWQLALEGSDRVDRAANRQIKALERELRRKEMALAEAAALLILKKKAQALGLIPDEDEDTDEPSAS